MADTPKIRFKGFADAWEQRKVFDIAVIIAGGTPSTSKTEYWEPKEIPWLSSGEVHKKYVTETDDMISEEGLKNSSAKWIEEGSVLIALAGQGKTRGTAAIARISMTTNQSIAAIKFDETVYPDYAFQNLDSRYDELRNISSGDGTRGGLNKQLLSDLEMMLPEYDEQKKIGDCFRSLDHLMTLHQHKCDETKELKRYMLQKMFPQNGEKNPQIRFAGFTDDWERRKLGELTAEFTEYTTLSSELPLLTSSRAGLMYQNEYRGNLTTDSKETLFSVIPLGACTYRHMSDDNIFHLNINTLEKGLVSREYPVFTASGDNELNFIVQHLNSDSKFRAFCAEQKKGGTRTRLYYKTLSEFSIMVPKSVEQCKISRLLLDVDHLITLHQRKCDELKEVKKFMLQNMFPQKG